MSPFAQLLALPIRAYRLIGSPWVGRHCRFQPTCSEYALGALEQHGASRGAWLTLRRLSRCRPGGGDGYDPVPEARRRAGSQRAPFAKRPAKKGTNVP